MAIGEVGRHVTPKDLYFAARLLQAERDNPEFDAAGHVLWLKRMSVIKRFSSLPEMTHRTDLFIHARRTAFLGEYLVSLLNNQGFNLDMKRVFRLGYHHDDPEILTDDLPSPLKHAMTDEEKGVLKSKERGALQMFTQFFFGERYPTYLSEQEELNEKQTPEAQLVDVADKWDALGEILHEVRCGNKAFFPLVQQYRNYFSHFKQCNFWSTLRTHPSLDFSNLPTVKQAQRMPPIKVDDLETKGKAWKILLDESAPACSRTWATISLAIFYPNPEKFIFPGWYLELWKRWGPPRGTTTAFGLYIP